MVIGSYASIETIELFERGGEEDIEQAQKNILWRMTTVSSPNLPWLLNLLVPRWITERKTATEIAKDVPLFLDWNASRS